jgi:hypothetical protein
MKIAVETGDGMAFSYDIMSSEEPHKGQGVAVWARVFRFVQTSLEGGNYND